ncbi:MAG: ABC-ATPase domain-containing protein [Firmicutes bacterium]|nr:ABC-ATPase domain-containing protein [Bacillota bacterium]
MKRSGELSQLLRSIDRKSYPAYKFLAGSYDFNDYILSIDHVQGDPFASPSRLSILVPARKAAFPMQLLDQPYKRTAAADYVLRAFSRAIGRFAFKAGGSGKSGLIGVTRPGQEVLSRTACEFTKDGLLVRFEVGFPAAGRTVLAGELEKILFDYLPKCAASALRYPALPSGEVEQAVFLSEDQQYIRKQLDSLGLCAFVADGSVLPRESGISDRPMEKAVPFSSPDSLAVTLTLPHRGQLRGMGIRKGITLIAGGGYHGKSTLLKALERGVYDHIAGDGREFVITDATAMKLRAEDGRKITNADISLFINDLPNKTDTHRFCTLDASGSTSQAAAIVEGIEAGSRLFLIDEDTSATNFMVRDALMEEVVSKNHEPITPFLERARDLYEKAGISTILVVGSCGSYFYVADTVLQMDGYRAFDITDNVTQVLKKHGEHRFCADNFCLPATDRILPLTKKNTGKNPAENNQRFSGKGRFDKDRSGGRPHKEHEHAKVKTLGKTSFMIDRDTLDLRYVEQLVDSEQTAALSYLLRYAKEHFAGSGITLTALVDQLEALLDTKGLASICDSSYVPVGLSRPRRQEIFACFNRY